MTVRIAAVDDWITAVKNAPEATALSRPATSLWSARRSESPARPFRPSVRWWIPSRNKPRPPTRVTTTAVSMDCPSYALIPRGNEPPALEGRLIVVSVFVGPLGELYLLAFDFLIRDQAEQVMDAVKTRASLVV